MSPHRLRQYRCRAVVAVLVLTSLIVLLGAAALAIDVGYIYNVRTDLQRAVDSAALAGASALSVDPVEVYARALDFAGRHEAGGRPILPQDVEVLLGRWDPGLRSLTPLTGDDQYLADACRVTVGMTTAKGNPVPLFFAHIFGRDATDVAASATAQFGTAHTWDLMIVQDKSGSFTGALEFAKDADRALVECLRDHTDNESQVGFVAYTGEASVVVPLQPLSTGFGQISAAIDALDPCCWFFCGSKLKCQTGTNIAAGIDAAVEELANSTSDPEIGRAIVLVSDGKPQSTVWVPYTDQELQAMAVASANAAAAEGISIFTIYYAGSSSTPEQDAAFLQQLTKGSGTFRQTPDPADLSALIWKVCASLPLMLVE